jgi:hypothetical protein
MNLQLNGGPLVGCWMWQVGASSLAAGPLSKVNTTRSCQYMTMSGQTLGYLITHVVVFAVLRES